MKEKLADLPPLAAEAVSRFVEAAGEVLGPDLRAAVLYGSAAEGRLRPTSDVNLALVLARFDPHGADRLRGPLLAAEAAARVRVLFLLESEIDEAARAFAQKFADLRRRRRVLLGADPFASLAIPREALVFRLKQVLLNQQLRLRAAYVARGLPEDQLVGVLASAAGPLRTAAASLLELEGQGALAPREALARVAGALPEARRWEEALARMSDARQGRPLAAGVPSRTLLDLIELTGRLKERVPS